MNVQFTNHGNPLTPDKRGAGGSPADRPDLTAEELDAALVELASRLASDITEIRDYATAVKAAAAERPDIKFDPPHPNRWILEDATRVFTPEAPTAPATVKIEIELSEEDAACLWSDATWDGRQPDSLDKLIARMAREAARKYRRSLPHEAADAVANFRRLYPR